MKKKNYAILGLSMLSFIATCFIYSLLPKQIPIHFDLNWNPNGYASKNMIFFMAALPLIFYFIFKGLLKIDPKKNNYEKYPKYYDLIIVFVILLMIVMNWLTIAVALKIKLNTNLIFPLIMGSIFIGIGNYMPKVKSNFFVGIKTPWALSNEVVWRKTNRFGGYLFIVLGLLTFIGAFVKTSWYNTLLIGILLVGIIANFVYSYVVYKKCNKGE